MISRRQFCGAFASCVGLAIVSQGCADGDSTNIVSTGGLNGPDTGHSGGSGSGSGSGSSQMPDAGVPTVDSGVAATCPASGATDVGAPSSFTANNPTYHQAGNFFVVRDANGLYAVTARCTHEGATCVVDQGEFYCPRHGAQFDFNGNIISGPVAVGLVHYAMCTMPGGTVGVITSQTVSQSQRLVA